MARRPHVGPPEDGAEVEGEDFARVDWWGAELEGVTFTRCRFDDASLEELVTRRCVFDELRADRCADGRLPAPRLGVPVLPVRPGQAASTSPGTAAS